MPLLRNRAYRNLFTAQVVALLGTGLLTIALGLLAYDLAPSSSGAVVGTALTIKVLAYVVLSPVIATAADRLPRRLLLVTADLIRAAVALMLPFVDAVWQVYVLIFVLQAASAAFTPAFQALIPQVVPDEHDYTRALSFSRLAYDLESLLSPVLAGVLLTVISYRGLFVGTTAGFLLSAALVVATTLPRLAPSAPDDREGFWSRMTHGTRLFGRTPALRGLLALDLAVAAATALVLVNTVVVVRAELGLGEARVAQALAAYGAGSIVVALLLPRMLRHLDDRTVMIAGGSALAPLLGLTALVLATLPGQTWSLVLVLWALLGAATSSVLTPSGRVLRRTSSEADLPAVFAAQFSLSHACFLLTYPLAGLVGAWLGTAVATGVLATVALTAALMAGSLWPRRVLASETRAATMAR